MSNSDVQTVYYFCDESSYLTDDYMSVGGLAVPDRDLAPITADLVAIKRSKGGPSEVKWSTVKSRRDSVHKAFVDYFAEAVHAKRIHFHIRFAPFNRYDHNASGEKKRIDTTSKMHFQLLLHRAIRFYGPHYKLRIRPDNGDCTASLVSQVDSLHSWGSYHYNAADGCIDNIEPRDSKKELMLQLLDVPLGALTALRNKRELIGPKRELADYVGAKFAHKNLWGSCGPKVMDFSVWNANPSGVPKRGLWG